VLGPGRKDDVVTIGEAEQLRRVFGLAASLVLHELDCEYGAHDATGHDHRRHRPVQPRGTDRHLPRERWIAGVREGRDRSPGV
jgi:hypothetical protein